MMDPIHVWMAPVLDQYVHFMSSMNASVIKMRTRYATCALNCSGNDASIFNCFSSLRFDQDPIRRFLLYNRSRAQTEPLITSFPGALFSPSVGEVKGRDTLLTRLDHSDHNELVTLRNSPGPLITSRFNIFGMIFRHVLGTLFR